MGKSQCSERAYKKKANDEPNHHAFGTSGMFPADSASRAGDTPEASGDSSSGTLEEDMTHVSREVSDEELLDLVRSWVDLLAAGDYQSAISRFGYSFSDTPNRECILSHLRSYRSEELYPGVTDFAVTDWRTAAGGNQVREQSIKWYDQPSPIAGAISYDLPLNGRWSDLTADFVLYAKQDEGYTLVLEEIRPFPVNESKR